MLNSERLAKAEAELTKAYAEWLAARAVWQPVDAAFDKAVKEWNEVCAEFNANVDSQDAWLATEVDRGPDTPSQCPADTPEIPE